MVRLSFAAVVKTTRGGGAAGVIRSGENALNPLLPPKYRVPSAPW